MLNKSSKHAFPKEIIENHGNKSKKVNVYFTGFEQNELDSVGVASGSEDDLRSGDEENCHELVSNEMEDGAQEEIRILKQTLKEKEIQKLKKRMVELETKKEDLELEVSNISLDNEMFRKAYKSEIKERIRAEELLAESLTSESSSGIDSLVIDKRGFIKSLYHLT